MNRTLLLVFAIAAMLLLLLSCAEDGCHGKADSCGSINTPVDCSNQDGCNWVVLEGQYTCISEVTACDDIDDADLCKTQKGCQWE